MKTSAYLRKVLSSIDVLYFDGQLEEHNTTVKWFRPPASSAQFLYGEVDLLKNEIHINSVLAYDWVPFYVVKNVLYHEALHIIIGYDHDPYFRLMEKQFPNHVESSLWEASSIDRLIKADRPLVRSLK